MFRQQGSGVRLLGFLLAVLAVSRAGAEARDGGSYSGLGVKSVGAEVVASFAPPPLDPGLTRRIQNLLETRSISNARVSPDGKRLFFTWAVTGTPQVWRLDGPRRFPVQLTAGEDSTSVEDIAPDGSYLVISRDRNGAENPGLYWLSPEGGPLEPIHEKAGARARFELISDDSRYVYFAANDVVPDTPILCRWNKTTRSREVVFDRKGSWSILDVNSQGRMLMAQMVGHHMDEVFEWDPTTKELRPLFGQGEREDYAASYGANGEILVLTPKFGEFRRLYRWRAGKFEPITAEERADIQRFDIDRARKRISYEVNDGGYTRLRTLDARTYRPIVLPSLPVADHVLGRAVSSNGRYQVISIDPGTRPAITYVLDWATRLLTQWSEPSLPETDVSRFVRPTLESYPARDGTSIPMFVWRPTRCEQLCPVVISFHGGPELQSRAGYNEIAQLFVGESFIYVTPNVRGSEGYGKTWLHADDGPKRLSVITDIEDASRYIRTAWAKGGKAPKIGVMGESYGGYAAMVGMTMFAGAFDAGVELVGPSNLVSFLENTAPYRRMMRISEYGDPGNAKEREALLHLSPISYVDRAKGPLLMMQGATDPRVPVGEAIQMHRALEARGVSNQLMIFADEGHVAQRRGNQALTSGHALAWFKKFLSGQGQERPN